MELLARAATAVNRASNALGGHVMPEGAREASKALDEAAEILKYQLSLRIARHPAQDELLARDLLAVQSHKALADAIGRRSDPVYVEQGSMLRRVASEVWDVSDAGRAAKRIQLIPTSTFERTYAPNWQISAGEAARTGQRTIQPGTTYTKINHVGNGRFVESDVYVAKSQEEIDAMQSIHGYW